MNLDDEAVMERHRNPRFKGFSGPGDVAATGDNPFCGDALEVRVVRGEADGAPMVARAAFDGYACSLCAATADLVMEHVTGMRVEDAERLTVDDVLALWGGLQVGARARGASNFRSPCSSGPWLCYNRTVRPQACVAGPSGEKGRKGTCARKATKGSRGGSFSCRRR